MISIDYGAVTECVDLFLRNQSRAATFTSAMTAFGQTGFGTGRRLISIGHRDVPEFFFCQLTAFTAYPVFDTSGRTAAVTERGNFLIGRIRTSLAGVVSTPTDFSTGGRFRFMILELMSKRCYVGILVGTAAVRTSVQGITLIGTIGCYYLRTVVMTDGRNTFGILMATNTSKCLNTVFFAKCRLCYLFRINMYTHFFPFAVGVSIRTGSFIGMCAKRDRFDRNFRIGDGLTVVTTLHCLIGNRSISFGAKNNLCTFCRGNLGA